MQRDIVLKKLIFDLSPLGSGGVCRQNICFNVATFRGSNKFDMQHHHILEKLNYDLLINPSGRGRGVCKQNICYHFATFRDSI